MGKEFYKITVNILIDYTFLNVLRFRLIYEIILLL